MDVTLSFVEYDAANGLRDLSPVAFTLLSTAKLGQIGNRRTWVVTGTPEALDVLRSNLKVANERFLRSSIAGAVANIVGYIDDALAAPVADAIAPPVVTAGLSVDAPA